MRTILVVDDDAEIRQLLEVVLEDAGYRVVTARDGREALAAMRAERPAVVVLDLLMPIMDGWELREAMLKDPALASIPVVVTSGAAELTGSRPLAATHIIAKPLLLPDLLGAIASS